MRVVITGGAGFLGLRLARRLLERGELTGSGGGRAAIDEIVLADIHAPAERPAWADDRISFSHGDIADPAFTASLVDRDDVSVFHLASVVSAQAETDLDLALRINIDGARSILDAARRRDGATRFVTTSSYAAFGGDVPEVCTDGTKLTPESTYGATKVIVELLVNDYTRRGAIDGRVARLPIVIVRPGAANLAASSLASAIFREPLMGRDYAIPVTAETRVALTGVRTVVEGLIALHEADGTALGLDRAVSFPSVPFTVGEMAETLPRVCGDRALGRLSWKPDPAVEAIVMTWPSVVDASRALAIGVPPTDSLERIVLDAAAEMAPATSR
jgi:nucleoside-diphosphate-sugar epimerase